MLGVFNKRMVLVFIILIAGCFQFSVNRRVHGCERRRKRADETLESPYDEEQVGLNALVDPLFAIL